MSENELTISWMEFNKFKDGISENEIASLWESILSFMPEKVLDKVPNEFPTLELFPGSSPKHKPDKSFALPYVFKFNNICNCSGVNQFLENFVIYIHW
jgi:hypothetical protein